MPRAERTAHPRSFRLTRLLFARFRRLLRRSVLLGPFAVIRVFPLPPVDEFAQLILLFPGDVLHLGAIGCHVVELPGGSAARRDDFPVSHPQRAISLMEKPDRVARDGAILRE